MAWIDLSQEMEFTDHAYKEFHPGKLLIFNFEGSKTYMKIKRIDGKKVWVTEVKTYSEEEFEKMTGAQLQERETWHKIHPYMIKSK